MFWQTTKLTRELLEKEVMNFLQHMMTTETNSNFHKGHGKKTDSLFLILLKANLGLDFNFLRMLARALSRNVLLVNKLNQSPVEDLVRR